MIPCLALFLRHLGASLVSISSHSMHSVLKLSNTVSLWFSRKRIRASTYHVVISPSRILVRPQEINGTRGMKRASPAKPRPKLPDYCDVEPKRDETGKAIWPAPAEAIEMARALIREWYRSSL